MLAQTTPSVGTAAGAVVFGRCVDSAVVDAAVLDDLVAVAAVVGVSVVALAGAEDVVDMVMTGAVAMDVVGAADAGGGAAVSAPEQPLSNAVAATAIATAIRFFCIPSVPLQLMQRGCEVRAHHTSPDPYRTMRETLCARLAVVSPLNA